MKLRHTVNAMRGSVLRAALLMVGLATTVGACAENAAAPKDADKPAAAAPTAESAKAWAEKVDTTLQQKWTDGARASWVAATYITGDTQALEAKATEDVLNYEARINAEAGAFKDLELDPTTDRMIYRLRTMSAAPAPSDPAKTAELAKILSRLQAAYGAGKWCPENADSEEACQDLGELSEVLATSRDYQAQLDAWTRWRTVSPQMRADYARFVELTNEGARELGFADTGDAWKARYDMTSAEFETEAERLWQQVKPMYDDLHCYVRGKLAKQYPGKVDANGKIPAHLLGNMWAQEWSNLYPLLEPFANKGSLDVTGALKAKKISAVEMTKLAESFFTGLGMKSLPPTFWERSMLEKPRDRDVVCHASAWDLTSKGDVRIKMCIKPTEEDLITIHHELGHIYYYLYYNQLPVLFQSGAHDGFHEAIGDALALSVTPQYLKDAGILKSVPPVDDEAVINQQLKTALDKIAFLPFGRMIDQWRWDVFAGKVKPEEYNAHWWKLRGQYQGIAAPEARPADAFDPGAKYHIPGNTPYVRYFLSFVVQFQFYKSMCEASGHKGPLHTCSFAGSKAAGDKLSAMLAMGASKPWPDALEAMTGTRQMDAAAILEYFAPLRTWLKTQNKGQTCGW